MLGIEVGLNANGRKNGKIKSIVEIFISEHCQKNSLQGDLVSCTSCSPGSPYLKLHPNK